MLFPLLSVQSVAGAVMVFGAEPSLQVRGIVRERLEDFITAINKRIEMGYSIPKRKQVRLYKKYLRVLDGTASGASLSSMAKILSDKENIYPDFAGNKDIENWKKAATKLSDFDYYFLPTL